MYHLPYTILHQAQMDILIHRCALLFKAYGLNKDHMISASEKGNLIYIIFKALSVYTFPSESVRRHDVVGLVSFLRSAPIFTNEKTSNAQ